jgi:myosin heavy subunit
MSAAEDKAALKGLARSYKDPFAEDKAAFTPNPKSLDGVPDLCMLTYLAERNVLHNLEYRYTKMAAEHRCYTSTTAKVLVAINPYERMDDQYTDAKMKAYQDAEINLEGLRSEKDLPPHVFAVANSAYRNLIAKGTNQSIIVCGESGSGKTESAKYMMRFLAFTTTSQSSDPSEFAEADSIGKQILDANPILESFGNAKTLINNNSSRFGKFTKMLFRETKDGKARRKLVGACIDSYLLEKARVVYQNTGERNYHVFYQLTYSHASMPDLKLGPPEAFYYTSRSQCTTLDDLRYPGKGADLEWFKELTHAFKTLLISEDEMMQAFSIVSAILHMGNIKFQQKKGEGSDILNADEVELAASLFQVDLGALTRRLEMRTMYLPGDKEVQKPLNEDDARFNRDSMSRNLYNGLFRYVVYRINKVSAGDSEGAGTTWIGILDVFGFEIFEYNSFEQFCINFANERLQQYFNEHVLKAEQDLYKREALLWDPIDLPDNQDCIDLVMSKPAGILAVLDSTCVQPKGDDAVFTANLFNAHKYHPRLRRAKQRKVSGKQQMENINGFTIRHYAGEVLYDCKEFLTKNSDSSEHDTLLVFTASRSSVASKVLRMKADGTIEEGDVKRSSKRAFLSTGTVFSDQLSSLMSVLRKTSPYFVRCVKPNPSKKPKSFIPEFVRPQLRCGGLIEALRIIKLGFPTRCAYKRITELFKTILKDKPVANLNERDFTEGIMKVLGDPTVKLSLNDYQLGLTMVFFRPGKQTFLTDILDKKAEAVSKDQTKLIRKHLVRKRWKRGIFTLRAFLKSRNLLQEVRFKKAALAMVITYRTIGRALIQARETIGVRVGQADEERRKRDMKFQEALRAAEELKKMQELQKKQQDELRRQADEAKRSLEAKEREIEGLREDAAKYLEKSQELQSKLSDSEAKRLKMQQNSASQAQELQDKIIAAQGDLERGKQKIAQLEAQIDGKNSEIAANQRAIADKQADLDKAKRDNESLREQMQELRDQGEKDVTAREKQLQEEKAAGQQREAELQGQLDEKKSELDRMNEELRRSEAKFNSLKDDAENKDRGAKDKYADYERQLAELRRRIEELENEIKALNDRMATLRKQAEEAALKAAEELKNARNEAREQQKRMDIKVQEKEADISRLNQELAMLRAQHESVSKSQKEALEQEREEGREKAERFEAQLAEKEAKLNEIKRQLALERGRLEAASMTAQSDSKRVQDLQNEHMERMTELQEKNERQVRKLEGRIKELESDLAIERDRLENVRREMQNALSAAEDAKSTLARQLKDKDSQLLEAKGEIRRLQARLETLQQSTADQVQLLQDQLNERRDEAREIQQRLEKELWEKNNELSQSKSELEQSKARLGAEKERAEEEAKAAKDQLEQEKKANQERQEKFQQDLQQRAEDITELKTEFKTEKKELRAKIEQLEKQRADLEHGLDEAKQKLSSAETRQTITEKNAKDAIAEEQNNGRKKEQKLLQQLDDAKKREGELEAELGSLKETRGSAAKEVEQQKDDLKKKEQEYKGKLDEQKQYIDKLEKDFTTFKASAGAETEAKMQALQGQVALLKQLTDEMKAEKRDFQNRDQQSREWLKDASAQIGELKSELKNVEAAHNTELEKLRLQLEASRERYLHDSRNWQEQADLYERQLIEKTGLLNQLRADLAEAEEQVAASTTQVKQKEQGTKEELKRLRELTETLQTEQKEWGEKEIQYEARVGTLSRDLIEARSKAVEAEHDKELALTEARSEKEVLDAKLEAEKKALLDLAGNFEKELKMHQARFAREIARLNAIHEGEIHNREQLARSQEDAYKYKLQYLERLNAEHKRAKEREKKEARSGRGARGGRDKEPEPERVEVKEPARDDYVPVSSRSEEAPRSEVPREPEPVAQPEPVAAPAAAADPADIADF